MDSEFESGLLNWFSFMGHRYVFLSHSYDIEIFKRSDATKRILTC